MTLYNHLVFIIQHILFWIINNKIMYSFPQRLHFILYLRQTSIPVHTKKTSGRIPDVLIWLFQYADNKSGY